MKSKKHNTGFVQSLEGEMSKVDMVMGPSDKRLQANDQAIKAVISRTAQARVIRRRAMAVK